MRHLILASFLCSLCALFGCRTGDGDDGPSQECIDCFTVADDCDYECLLDEGECINASDGSEREILACSDAAVECYAECDNWHNHCIYDLGC